MKIYLDIATLINYQYITFFVQVREYYRKLQARYLDRSAVRCFAAENNQLNKCKYKQMTKRS